MLPTALDMVYWGSNGFPLVREKEKEGRNKNKFYCKVILNIFQQTEERSVHSLLALFVFESITQEVAFHLNVVFQ